MSRSLHRLNVKQANNLDTVGRHADGGGLYLRITRQGSRSWVFMAKTDAKKRTEIGLGAVASITLGKARDLAAKMREAVALGDDPRSVLRPKPRPSASLTPTFGTFATDYITSIEAGWKSSVHRQQWHNSIRDHCGHILNARIDRIDTDMVLAVLKPIWLAKPETASRLRSRIERVLDAAKALGLRERESINPAALKGHLALLLPKQSDMVRGHHKALPYAEMPSFMINLRARSALAARCLEFTILTGARSGEALEATWSEIDLKQRRWTVPASRMKAGQEHVVPLSGAVVTLLETLRPDHPKPNDRIFAIAGATRSNMAMALLLRRMSVAVTVHGFRSTFRDWAGDETQYAREIVEQALAHSVGSKVERAYRRGTAIERRRELMDAWACFLAFSSSEVIGEIQEV